MCRHGDTVPVRVWIAPDLSCDGKGRWKDAQVDRCIAPLVAALQQGGIAMRGSCCGHGRAAGKIDLQDGRTLTVGPSDEATRTEASE